MKENRSMARPLRISLIGGWYHLTARGNERRAIFRDDTDREHFLSLLAQMVSQYRFRLHAYVLMPNHYHLLVEISQDNLSRGMQWLNVSYSQWFNRRHRRVGHLLQGRFGSVLLERERWGVELSRYLHLNPVRVKGLGLGKRERQGHRRGVGRAADEEVLRARLRLLREYRWSSYRAYVGREKRPDWLTCEAVWAGMGGRKTDRPRAYQEYTEKAILEGAQASPWEFLQGQAVLGEEGFVKGMQRKLKGDEREQAGLRALRGRPDWERVVKAVEVIKGERWERFRDRRGDWGRDAALWLGRRWCGMKLRELSQAVGLGHYGSVGTAIKYLEQRCQADPKLARLMNRARQQLLDNE
jgi:REP-associated tyrosine transposase